MKNTTMTLAYVLALSGAMAVTAQMTPAPAAHAQHPTPPAAEAQLDIPAAAQAAVSVVEHFGSALAQGDLKTAGALLDADVLILETGGAERSRDEYLGHHAIADAQFLKGSHSQLKRRKAGVAGDLAWVGT